MAQDTVTTEKVEAEKPAKTHVDLSAKVAEREEIGGYVTSKYAAKFLSEKLGKDVPVTTVNNSAYAGKIEAFRIGGIFLLKLNGEKSVTAFIDTLASKTVEKSQASQQKARNEKAKNAKTLFAKYVNDAIKKGEAPDLDALRKELGL